MTDQREPFAIVPAAVIPHCTASEFRVYVVLRTYMSTDSMEAYPSVQAMAERGGIEERAVRRGTNALAKKGLIRHVGLSDYGTNRWVFEASPKVPMPAPKKGGGKKRDPLPDLGDDGEKKGMDPLPDLGSSGAKSGEPNIPLELTSELTIEQTTCDEPDPVVPQMELIQPETPSDDAEPTQTPADIWVERFHKHWPKKVTPGKRDRARLTRELDARGLDECLRILDRHASFLAEPPESWRGNGASDQSVPKVFSENIIRWAESHVEFGGGTADAPAHVHIVDPEAARAQRMKDDRLQQLEWEVTAWATSARSATYDENDLPPIGHPLLPHEPLGTSTRDGVEFPRFPVAYVDLWSCTAAAYRAKLLEMEDDHEFRPHVRQQIKAFTARLQPTKADIIRFQRRLQIRQGASA